MQRIVSSGGACSSSVTRCSRACAVALLLLTLAARPSVWSIYAVLVAVGSARAFAGPASQALVPNLVPPRHFSNAVAWSSSIWHVATIAGPALGGFLYGVFDGAGPVYATAAVLELAAVACLLLVKTRAGASEKKPATSWHSSWPASATSGKTS